MFLEKVYEGKNDIGRWIAVIVILLIITQFVGGLPLGIMIFLKMSDNPDLEPDPENLMDLSAYDISPITGLALMIIPFALGLITLLLLMKPIHERPMLSVITGNSSFRWKKFFWGAGVWFLLLSAYTFFASVTGIQKIELQFDPSTIYALAVVSVLLLPFQTGFEEVLFRGYLMQGFAKIFKYRWIPLIISALIFGSLHFFNPEVKEYGALITMPQYIWFGVFFGICTLMEEGLELAWGVHAINNIFLSIFFTQDSSALQTPALYRITDFNPLFDLIALVILSVIFIFIARQKFKWPKWHYLLATIDKPDPTEDELSEFIEDEYDEYKEK
ncbi:MAG: CPBP family intramembrane metalloprotease [Bacteroidia bacterium]|nr:CPBP family intramembrane metalloprotease [Bacteroidia bacterium]